MTQVDPLNLRIARLAEGQHGVVALTQLRALGLQPSTVRMRLKAGRLHRIHRGVYAVAGRRLHVAGRRMAAVLACGEDAVLSHRTAGDALGVLPSQWAGVDVTVPSRAGVSVPGVTIHRSSTLVAADRTQAGGMPCTSVARTLLDLADVVPERRLTHAIAEAERLRLYDDREVEATVERAGARPAARRLRHVLVRFEEPDRCRTELEAMASELFRAAGLPRPLTNARIETHAETLEVDFYWPDCGTALEADSNRWHSSRSDFENDRRRDQLLRAVGVTVIRATWRQIEHDGEVVVRALKSAQQG